MTICIFGADGRTGIEVTKAALDKGFKVVAFVYSQRGVKFLPHGIKVVQGNVLEFDSVKNALEGCDAVISVLGHIKESDPRIQTKGIKNISRAMKELGIERIISLTGTGVRIPKDEPSFIDRILNFFVELIDPERINDGREHVKVLQESGLDYTVVRVLKLSNAKNDKQSYKITPGGPAELVTSREKVARVMLDCLADSTWLNKYPVISG